MRKVGFVVLLMLSGSFLFAESETYFSLTTNFGNIGISKNDYYYSSSKKEKDKIKFDIFLNGGGLAFQTYTFWNNQNVGLFTNFPVTFGGVYF